MSELDPINIEERICIIRVGFSLPEEGLGSGFRQVRSEIAVDDGVASG